MPKRGAYTSEKLFDSERLGHVIVCTEVERGDLLLFLLSRR